MFRSSSRCSLWLALLLAPLPARAESKHIFGIHTWDWGANVDVMSQRTGWVVEAHLARESPNIGGRVNPAVGEGFTMILRLDWEWEQTIPLTSSEHDTFATQCGNWARAVKKYCRYYCIGNEVEYFGVTPAIYAPCFQKVRDAILAEQPEARVIIGHMNNIENQGAVMDIVGPNGYDGVTAHTGSSVPVGLLDILDQRGARPGVGVYITEWGWVKDTNPNSQAVMQQFYLALGQSNATRARQVYAACWYLYPPWEYLHPQFSLADAVIDNPAFEAATAIGTSVNPYAANPVLISNLTVDVPDVGVSATLAWATNVPARRQLWYTPTGTSGSGFETVTPLGDVLSTGHQITASSLAPESTYDVMPLSTANDHGDAGGTIYQVKTGPWSSSTQRIAPGVVRVSWSTDWPADSRVEYGPTPALGQIASDPALTQSHEVELSGLTKGEYYYRTGSAQPPPPDAATLVMRSPIRTFTVLSRYRGDFDADDDVDMSDFAVLQNCFSGPGIDQNDPLCPATRLDSDLDVDPADLQLFLECLSGADVTPPSFCEQT